MSDIFPEVDPSVGSYKVSPFLKQEVHDQIANRDPKRRISWNWYDTWQEEHHRAFVVAKMCKADLLQEVHDSLQKAVDSGMTFEEWRKEITAKLEKNWLGRSYADIWTNDMGRDIEELPVAQRDKVIAPKRLETIYRTNMKVAHAAGQYQALKARAYLYPYWRYCTQEDGKVRHGHAILNDKVFRHDDPFWDTHYPPNGWNCRCYVRAMDEDDLKDEGLTVTDSRELQQSQYLGKFSGKVQKAYDIDGITVPTEDGWNYNPGNVRQYLGEVMKAKISKYAPELAQMVKDDVENYPKQEQKLAEPYREINARFISSMQEYIDAKHARIQNIIKITDELAPKVSKQLSEFEAVEKAIQNIAKIENIPGLEDSFTELPNNSKRQRKIAKAISDLSRIKKIIAKVPKDISKNANSFDKNKIKKLADRFLRLEKLSIEAKNNITNEEKALTNNKNNCQSIVDYLKLDDKTERTRNSKLEYAIASKENELLEEELQKAEKAGIDKHKLDSLRKRAEDILSSAKSNLSAINSDDIKENIALVKQYAGISVATSEMSSLHEEAFKLRISQYSQSQEMREVEKRRKVFENRKKIKASNANIFTNSYDIRVLQRELDLVMYNMSPDELTLYRGYSERYVKDNDYRFTGNSHYSPRENKVHVEFEENPYPELYADFDYSPKYNWKTRFHEEGHHLDSIFKGEKYVLSHPKEQGQEFLDSLNKDGLDFINVARAENQYQPVRSFTRDTYETLKSILDFMLRHHPKDSIATAPMIDNLGLCSHDTISRPQLNIFRKEITKLGRTKYNSLKISGHNPEYNIRDRGNSKKKEERHLYICDETSEGFAEFMEEHWNFDSAGKVFRRAHMRASDEEASKLLKMVIARSLRDDFKW